MGIDSMSPGPRDHLITSGLEQELDRLDPEVRVEVLLDPAEGPSRRAHHAMREVKRELTVDETAAGQARHPDRNNPLGQPRAGVATNRLHAQLTSTLPTT